MVFLGRLCWGGGTEEGVSGSAVRGEAVPGAGRRSRLAAALGPPSASPRRGWRLRLGAGESGLSRLRWRGCLTALFLFPFAAARCCCPQRLPVIRAPARAAMGTPQGSPGQGGLGFLVLLLLLSPVGVSPWGGECRASRHRGEGGEGAAGGQRDPAGVAWGGGSRCVPRASRSWECPRRRGWIRRPCPGLGPWAQGGAKLKRGTGVSPARPQWGSHLFCRALGPRWDGADRRRHSRAAGEHPRTSASARSPSPAVAPGSGSPRDAAFPWRALVMQCPVHVSGHAVTCSAEACRCPRRLFRFAWGATYAR